MRETVNLSAALNQTLARAERRIGASSQRELAATLLAGIAVAGAGIGLTTFVMPHPEGTHFVAPGIAFVCSVVAGAILWVRRRRASWAAIAVVVALGAAVVTVAMVSVPGRAGSYATYYVWLGIFSFYFLRPGWALAQTAWIAVLYAFAVVLDGPPGPLELWINGVATTLGVGLLVLALRTRIASLVSRLESAARTDVLTGLPNRRAFDERLEHELARAERSGEPISLLVLDLDRFKQLNDTSGHLTGDEALRAVADVLSGEVRGIDWPARIGGDEFAIVLPGASEAAAAEVGDRLRGRVATEFAHAAVAVTASIGLATDRGREIDADALRARADRALYRAKRQRDSGGAVAGRSGVEAVA